MLPKKAEIANRSHFLVANLSLISKTAATKAEPISEDCENQKGN